MKVHPTIAALRSDGAPQRHAQKAMEAARLAWRAEPGASEMLAEFKAFGEGAPLAEGGHLERVFTGQGEGERLMLALTRIMCRTMAQNPLAHPPLRNGADGRATSILLGWSGRAQLLMHSRLPGDHTPQGYAFSDVIRYDAVLSGEANGRLVRFVEERGGQARFSEEPITLCGGTRLALDMTNEFLAVDTVTRPVITLRLMRTAEHPAPTREYTSKSGAFVGQCAGDLATSRQEAIVALLGQMGRTDAAPPLAAIATGEGDPSLRWQSLRECLALDTAGGIAALCQLARNPDDPLSRNAGALRAQLIETYPELARLEDDTCPA